MILSKSPSKPKQKILFFEWDPLLILRLRRLFALLNPEVHMKEKVLDWLLGVGLASVMLLATAL